MTNILDPIFRISMTSKMSRKKYMNLLNYCPLSHILVIIHMLLTKSNFPFLKKKKKSQHFQL